VGTGLTLTGLTALLVLLANLSLPAR